MLPTALRGAFQSCGQNCAGAERFIVQEKVFDEFVRSVSVVGIGRMPCIQSQHACRSSMHSDQNWISSTAKLVGVGGSVVRLRASAG